MAGFESLQDIRRAAKHVLDVLKAVIPALSTDSGNRTVIPSFP